MSVFIIGDLHLSFDENVDKPMDIYGGVWVEHWKRLYHNWQREVKEEDTVILAGDTSWALKLSEAMADLRWISNLNGRKVIIKGNHDLWWSGIKKLNSMFENIYFMQNSYYAVDDVAICGTRGWICPGSESFEEGDMKLYRREALRLEESLKMAEQAGYEKIIGVLHYPPTNEKRNLSEFTRLFESFGVKKVYYGHLHNEDAKKNRESINLNGVSYKLISFDAIGGNLLKII